VLSFLCINFVSWLWPYYVPAMGTIAAFHIYQWSLLNGTGREQITAFFDSDAQPVSVVLNPDIYFFVLPIFSVTLIITTSIHLGAFGFSSRYDFPLLSFPTVYLADLLLLPMINYQIVRWFKEFYPAVRSLIGRASRVAAVVLIGNWYLHWRIWARDPWTAYMDTSYGKLTVAGWLHFLFSSFELWLLGLFLISWLGKSSWSNPARLAKGKGILRYLLVFCLFGILDFVLKYWRVFRLHPGAWNLVQEATWSLLPLIAVFLVYIWVSVRPPRIGP
jgi:hypothetical protein